MNKFTLEQYSVMKLKAASIEERIIRLTQSVPRVEYGCVKGSNSEFPYEPRSFKVSGFNIVSDEKRRIKIEQLKADLQKTKDKATDMYLQIEDYIGKIEDPSIQIIFAYRYIDGMTWDKIARKMGYQDESVPRKRHDRFLKMTDKTEINML